mgnify:CR=1 FL=1|tara:strand:+ start:189 stop:491 length:303 start_codon:yes stop_codon:yes gene_type:complete
MKHEAIRIVHPNVQTIDDTEGCFDFDGNKVEINTDAVNKKIDELRTDFDSKEYARNRQKKYPNEHDLIVALWEKVMEGKNESADALELKRQEVKIAHPKT